MPDLYKMTQKEMILYHLQNHKTITQNEAKELYGINRLPSRVFDLRCDGHNIVKKMVTAKNKFNKSCTFAEYRLEDVG